MFTTLQCPVCKLTKRELGRKAVPYKLVVCEELPDLVKQFDIKKAPTLVVNGDKKYVGLSAIKRYLETEYGNN